MPIAIVCLCCSVVFHVPPSKMRAGAAYCSSGCYHKSRRRLLETRFWEKVDKSGDCWVWTAGTTTYGYGCMPDEVGRPAMAHRLSWRLHFGVIPRGMCVCHHCDNPPCVRPDHLFLGTKWDNSQDMLQKKRCHCSPQAIGERNSNSKLMPKQVLEIRDRYATGGITQASLAYEYGISCQGIHNIVMRKTWKHI